MGQLIELLKKNGKMQALILLLVALLVADIGFYLIRVGPASEKAVELEQKLEGLRKTVAGQEAEYAQYAAYQKSLLDAEKFKTGLPRRSEFTDVLEKVYRLAKDDGMSGGSFGAETRGVKQEGELVQITFSMPIYGKYKDVRKFIYDVETSSLFLNINSLGLSKAGEADEITLSIGISTYVRS